MVAPDPMRQTNNGPNPHTPRGVKGLSERNITMELTQLLSTQGYVSKPGEDRGKLFSQAVDIVQTRAEQLKPEDRGVKGGSLIYAGQQEIQKGMMAHTMGETVSKKTYA